MYVMVFMEVIGLVLKWRLVVCDVKRCWGRGFLVN